MKKRIAYSVERIVKKEIQTNYFYPLSAKRYTLNKGFTLIEMITAIVLIGIIMIPVALMAIEYVRSIAYADNLTMAANLGRREMGIVNNLNYTDPTLADGYNNTTQNYAGYNFDLKRMVNYVAGTANNLKRVRVMIYPHGSTGQLIELITYVMNVLYGAGSTGGALGDEASSFLASAGSLTRNNLTNVILRNTRGTGNITMTSVILTSTVNKTLRSILMGSETRFSGSVALPANTPVTIALQKNFYMNSSTTYSGINGGRFNFAQGPNQSYIFTIKFIFYDSTPSTAYSWRYR